MPWTSLASAVSINLPDPRSPKGMWKEILGPYDPSSGYAKGKNESGFVVVVVVFVLFVFFFQSFKQFCLEQV